MKKLTQESLMTLEAYAKARKEYRERVIAHKKNRTVHLGDHVTLIFEDEITMRYQVQEMLRAEKIFEEAGIQEEIEAYNPLIPDGRNFKATMMIEYDDVEERRAALAKLKGIEDRTWVRVSGFDPVYAVADEDLERENEEKTSSVHFLRFQLGEAMSRAAKEGAALAIGVSHDNYRATLDPVPESIRASLAGDLDSP
ncbi:MAG TPA: DUF3501 family protein [Usitatibacter sp.]|nr:DUF3501 family protein [Usitatibacter sp.]